MNMARRTSAELFESEGDARQLERIIEWAATTDDGSRQGLDMTPDRRVWSKVNAEAGNCLGRNCQFYDRCFYQAGKRRMQNANVLVANHHFLFADMGLRRVGWNLLPDFQHLIIDEAHAVEGVAGEYLGMRVSRAQVMYVLQQLISSTGKGLLPSVGAPPEVMDKVASSRDAAERFFAEVDLWRRRGRPPNLRIETPDLFHLELADELEALSHAVRDVADSIDTREQQQEVAARAGRCMDLSVELRAIIKMARPDHVYWLEVEGVGGRNLTLKSAPIDVGEELGDYLWERLKSVTLTSATLSAGGDRGFDHLTTRLGLENTTGLALGSPFQYETQARLIVDAGMPDPRQTEDFENALPDAVIAHLRRTGGNAFVLFTSYSSLSRCYDACVNALRSEGYTVMRQGEGLPRGRLLEEFRSSHAPVLFGTSSFWEGVDVPGDALQNVIITRLPFAVPTHPLQQARTEAIRDRGGQPFFEYALPHAILRFKQGFGRLIRTRRDTGIVVVLDNRLVSMRYGRQFLDALPKLPVEVVNQPGSRRR